MCNQDSFPQVISCIIIVTDPLKLFVKMRERLKAIKGGTHQIKLKHFAWLWLSNKEDFLFCFLIGESDKSLQNKTKVKTAIPKQKITILFNSFLPDEG